MSTDSIPQNIAQTILDQAAHEASSRVETFEAHDGTEVQVLIARQGISAATIQGNLDTFAAIPRSRAGKVRAFDLDSFAALILRDYDAGSIVMADVSGQGVTFEACLDYHHAIAAPAPTAEIKGPFAMVQASPTRSGQRHGREVVFYDPSLSDEWKAWLDQSGKEMSQGAFAQWIEDHLPDIADPRHLRDSPDCTAAKFGAVYGFDAAALYGYATPERMVELSRGLEIRSGEAVKNFVKLESGETSITYEQTHTGADGKPLSVPSRFLLAISVFDREAVYLIPCKLAYRKAGANVAWKFEMYRPDRFKDDAIKGMVADLAKRLTPAAAQTEGKAAPVVPIHLARRCAQ